jgi:hypothetical protein
LLPAGSAIRHEAAAAIRHWWAVGIGVVWRWRKALGVGHTDNEGSARRMRDVYEDAEGRQYVFGPDGERTYG